MLPEGQQHQHLVYQEGLEHTLYRFSPLHQAQHPSLLGLEVFHQVMGEHHHLVALTIRSLLQVGMVVPATLVADLHHQVFMPVALMVEIPQGEPLLMQKARQAHHHLFCLVRHRVAPVGTPTSPEALWAQVLKVAQVRMLYWVLAVPVQPFLWRMPPTTAAMAAMALLLSGSMHNA